MGTDLVYYQEGQRVEFSWRESIPGEGVFNRTDTGIITDVIPNRCKYVFIYIDTDNNGSKVQNIGRGNKQDGRIKLI